jgi:hypothetical protein
LLAAAACFFVRADSNCVFFFGFLMSVVGKAGIAKHEVRANAAQLLRAGFGTEEKGSRSVCVCVHVVHSM